MDKLWIAVLGGLLLGGGPREEDAFEALREDFRRGVVELLDEREVGTGELQARLSALALVTLGTRADVLRAETERRFGALPTVSASVLEGRVERVGWETLEAPPEEARGLWLVTGWNPEALGAWVRGWVFARHLDVEEFGRRSLLAAYGPDRLARLDTDGAPVLVIDTLGDLLLVRLEWTDAGVLRPDAVRWLTRG